MTKAFVVIVVVLATTLALTEARPRPARPRFLVLPLDDVQLVRVPRRVARRAPMMPEDHVQPEEHEPLARAERSGEGGGGGDHHDYVDYGAHTGHKGSFGWYADFPVIKHH